MKCWILAISSYCFAEDACIDVNPSWQTDLPMPRGCSGRLLIRQAARPQWGSGRAAWREPGASDLRAFQAPLVRTGGLPSRIR
jgi:hypothetical protein